MTSEKRIHVFFCKRWEPFSEVKQCWAPFLLEFSGIFTGFQQIKTFGGTLSPPAPPLPTPLSLENPLLAIAWKKSFWRSCLWVHAHLPKCWRGTWPEKVWEHLIYSVASSFPSYTRKGIVLVAESHCVDFNAWANATSVCNWRASNTSST